VSGFVQALNDAMAKGFPDDVGTYGLVSGMWFSMMSLGCFVGSSVGGALTDNYSFQHGSYFVLFLQAFVAVWTIAFIIIFRNRKVVVDVESSSECYTQKGDVVET
jgi:MFS family permease